MADTVGSRLEELCARAKISFRRADTLAKKTQGHCQAIVRGTSRAPEAATLLAYCAVFGSTLDWLAAGRGTPPSDADLAGAVAAATARIERRGDLAVELLHDATVAVTRGAA